MDLLGPLAGGMDSAVDEGRAGNAGTTTHRRTKCQTAEAHRFIPTVWG
jgi:hypothetical protein